MKSSLWIPSILASILLIAIYIGIFAGMQTVSWTQKLLKIFLGITASYLLLPLIYNSSTWALHGPSPPPEPPPQTYRSQTTGAQYAELARNPEIQAEEFLERLAPFLRSAPIGIPFNRKQLLQAWGEKQKIDSKSWELHPPAGLTIIHTNTLLNTLGEEPPKEQTEILLFLLQLGNQLSNLPYPETYQTGREILRQTLIRYAKSPNLLNDPRLQREIQKIQELPAKAQLTQKRDSQRRLHQLEQKIWAGENNISLNSLLINRNTLLKQNPNQTHTERAALKKNLLLYGQLYHSLLLDQLNPTNLSTKDNQEQPSLEQKLSRLSEILMNKNPEKNPARPRLEPEKEQPSLTPKPENQKTPIETVQIQKSPQGWIVQTKTPNGEIYTHPHTFNSQKSAQKFSEKILSRKTIHSPHWKKSSPSLSNPPTPL
jgi:hypothetical protein